MIAEVAGLALGAANAGLNFWGQERTNAANARQAQKQMDFQRDMSSTSYQRAVADMRAAGLNPALAYQQGGASSPAGASAQLGNSVAAGTSGAAAAAQTYQGIQTAIANREAIRAQAEKTKAETNQLNLESALRLAEIGSRTRLNTTNADNTEKLYPYIRREMMARGYRTEVEAAFADRTMGIREEEIRQRIRNMLVSAREGTARAAFTEALTPEALNRAIKAQTLWGKHVTPYLGDASQLLQLLSKTAIFPYGR